MQAINRENIWRLAATLTTLYALSGCSSSSSEYEGNVSLLTPSACGGATVQSEQSSGFLFVQSAAPESTQPSVGVSVNEAGYGQCLTRMTQAQTEPPVVFARTDYSRRQAFNSDGSRMLIVASDGAWHLYDPRVPSYVQQIPGFAGAVEPQWHATDPDLISYLPDAGARMQVVDLDLVTLQSSVVGDLGARLKLLWPAAAIMNTGAEGSPSADGRFWAFQVSDAAQAGLGVFVWDKLLDVIISHLDIATLPDHLSMSPSGQNVVVSWAEQTVSYNLQLENPQILLNGTEHSDLAIGADGEDYYVAIDYSTDDGDLFMTNLLTGQRTALVPTYIAREATTLHVSGKAYDLPGWVVVSTFDMRDEDPQWFYQRIWLVELQPNPRMIPLGFHQSKLRPAEGSANYFAEPHATINKAGTRVVFNSNWNSDTVTDVDVYAIDIPPIDEMTESGTTADVFDVLQP